MGHVNLGMKGQHDEASGLTTLGCAGGFVEMAGPREHHFWPPQGLSAPAAKDMGNMPGKLLGVRASSGAAGKIRHNRSKIENFIEVKSNRAAELSPMAGAQPATHWGTKKGAGISWGTWGTAWGEWVVLTHGAPGRRQSHRHSLPLSLPGWLRTEVPKQKRGASS